MFQMAFAQICFASAHNRNDPKKKATKTNKQQNIVMSSSNKNTQVGSAFTSYCLQEGDIRSLQTKKLKFDIDRELFPFESHFFTSKSTGAEVHYVDEGGNDGRTTTTVLMLHGNPTWSFLHRKMISGLKHQGFRCVALDYPGFGLSTAPQGCDFLPATHAKVVKEFVEALDLKDYVLVAQDWGRPIGLWVAEQAPHRVKGLVIGNTWAWPLRGTRRCEMFSWIMGGPIGRAMAWAFNGVWHYFMKEGFVHHPTKQEMTMHQAPFACRHDRHQTSIFPRQLVQSYEFEADVEAGLDRLASKDVLFLWGTHDFAFQEPAHNRFMKLFPKHKCHPLDASHFWQDDQGEAAAQHVIDWAEQTMLMSK